MAKKHELRELRSGTIINVRSKKQEARLVNALRTVEAALVEEFHVRLAFKTRLYLKEIAEDLSRKLPSIDFHYEQPTSHMRPDGGILCLMDEDRDTYPILITEVKNQGTNDLRIAEGKGRQAQGNAIERLGKNVIGFRTALSEESIFPFICFGDGCDFAEGSSIRDRVVTIAKLGQLNRIYLHNEGERGRFDRGSFFFRHPAWTAEEMVEPMLEIARGSVFYYFSKYGDARFLLK